MLVLDICLPAERFSITKNKHISKKLEENILQKNLGMFICIQTVNFYFHFQVDSTEYLKHCTSAEHCYIKKNKKNA